MLEREIRNIVRATCDASCGKQDAVNIAVDIPWKWYFVEWQTPSLGGINSSRKEIYISWKCYLF